MMFIDKSMPNPKILKSSKSPQEIEVVNYLSFRSSKNLLIIFDLYLRISICSWINIRISNHRWLVLMPVLSIKTIRRRYFRGSRTSSAIPFWRIKGGRSNLINIVAKCPGKYQFPQYTMPVTWNRPITSRKRSGTLWLKRGKRKSFKKKPGKVG